MSFDEILSPEAIELLGKGNDEVTGFQKGKPSKILALQLAGHKGPLRTEERKKLCEEFGLGDKSLISILTRLRKMKLWDDDRGGLGRKREQISVKVEAPVIEAVAANSPQLPSNSSEHAQSRSPASFTDLAANGPIAANGSPTSVGMAATRPPESAPQAQKGPPEVEGDGGNGQNKLTAAMFEFMNNMGKRLDAIESKAATSAPSQPVAPLPAATLPSPTPSPVQPGMDFLAFMRFVQGLPPEQKRLYFGQQATEKPGDPMLQVFQQLESDHAWVDIMEEQNIGFEDMQRYVEKFNTMKKLNAEKENLSTPYLAAWYDACRTIGENMRRGCPHYNEPDGTCTRWGLEDIAKAYRDTYRGMYRAMRNKEGFLFNVERCPEICAVCGRAKVLEGEE